MRVVIDNDWAGDPDGLVALAHHVLSPSNKVVGVTSSFLSPMFGPNAGGAERGSALALELLALLGRPEVPVASGVDMPFKRTRPLSAAATMITDVARTPSELPLVVVCGGPLTNVAEALAADGTMASRFTLVWVGGSVTDDAEYNRDTDSEAAAFVLAHPELVIRQIPLEIYRALTFTVAELEHSLTSTGELGAWLWQRFVELPLPDFVSVNPIWPLGDSAPIVVTALPEHPATSSWEAITETRSVCTAIDTRLVVGDMLARFALHEKGAPGSQ
ncbi:inosine-uridine nucleoside N-ribohydrolase [Okibacterium sp. HSC-33S16]|uniref:nucleoside hydrolase n=1 Tax=Okibacterium sp. HSC-33S16 TaxID=2910965 RepID=UPI00209CE207|nr:nucleoside hydrolase [Okibacterium sp. HSC-33S16]MCP2031096.1 inosine-uridine nucleoside N-ribohydrolase [Okibacterium sp. HSC-33S16]